MLAAADGQEWGRLAELEARRSLAISEFFASSDCRHDSRDGGGRAAPGRFGLLPSRDICTSLYIRTAAEDATAIRACIQRVLDLNGRVIARGETGLRTLAGEIANLGQGRRAHKAYGDVGDG